MTNTIVKKIYVLDGGTITLDSSCLISGYNCGQRVVIPVSQFLVQTNQGYILVDTGSDPNVIKDPVGVWGAGLVAAATPTMTEENHICAQMAKIGVSPEDVKVVIYTHLHHDHAGGARFFPHARHVVQKKEYSWAYGTDRFCQHIYLRTDFDHPLNWFLVEGDLALFSGVHLILTPGHTPGHQSVILWDVPDVGTVILCGDAIYLMDNVRRDAPQGIATNTRDVMDSMHRLTALAETHDAMLFVGHDMDFFKQVQKCPEPLRRLPEKTRRYWSAGKALLYPGGMPALETKAN